MILQNGKNGFMAHLDLNQDDSVYISLFKIDSIGNI